MQNQLITMITEHEGFDFEYVGNIELAKKFGSYPIYSLQRSGYKYEN